MAVAGMILSNVGNASLSGLTGARTMASVPFGGRYRLVDFPLSNMVNAGMTKIGILAQDPYQSLMDHIGTGKDWDLARRSGGIKILTVLHAEDGHFSGARMAALLGVKSFIERCHEEDILLSDCDGICNLDVGEVLRTHTEKSADVTVVTRSLCQGESLPSDGANRILTDDEGRILEIVPHRPKDQGGEISTNIMVIRRTFLLHLLEDAAAQGTSHFYRDALGKRIASARLYGYHYEGVYLQVSCMADYFSASMRLLEPSVRDGLFNVAGRPVYTKLRNSAPTFYAEGSRVVNSYVADGCVIEGEVENSILFRGVHVGKGSVIRNSILMQGSFVGNHGMLHCTVADKNTMIRDGRMLSGHESMPFFIPKGTML